MDTRIRLIWSDSSQLGPIFTRFRYQNLSYLYTESKQNDFPSLKRLPLLLGQFYHVSRFTFNKCQLVVIVDSEMVFLSWF